MTDHRLTIGFAGIADFQNIRGQKLVSGVLQAVEDFDVNLISFSGAIKYSLHDDLDFISHYGKNYRFFHASNLNGLIAWASTLDEFFGEREIVDLHRTISGIPLVSLGTIRIPGIPGILTRSGDGIDALMDHLVIHHGYQRVGFLGSIDKTHLRIRYETYRSALDRHGLVFLPEACGLLSSSDRPEVASTVDRWVRSMRLKDRGDLDAILTVTDSIASLLIEELQKRGIRVPEDVAVVGFNNDLLSINTPVPITTVDLGFYEKGYEAVRLLLQRIASPDDPSLREHRYLPATLVVRQSCGCFEDVIANAGLRASLVCEDSNGLDLPQELLLCLERYAPNLRRDKATALIDALVSDLAGQTRDRCLTLIRDYLSESIDRSTEQNRVWQQIISDLRQVIYCRTADRPEVRQRMENLVNQARVLVSVINSYVVFSKRSDAYKFHALARIAIDFAQALDPRQIIDTLKQHLDELEMPGLYLVLQESLTPDLAPGHLALAYPYLNQIDGDDQKVTILPGRLPPATFLPQGRRFSLMMEILYHQGSFLGYALLEIGPSNVSLYDTVRILLSHSLYAAYRKEGRVGEVTSSPLIRKTPTTSIFEVSGRSDDVSTPSILEYLMNRLDVPTDLEAFARDLNMSKSHLNRKAKALTGHTIQDLHELLKIERAKVLLEQRTMKVSVVAERLGYSNQNYFSLVFKKVTGMAPRHWIQRKSRNSEPIL